MRQAHHPEDASLNCKKMHCLAEMAEIWQVFVDRDVCLLSGLPKLAG